MLGAAGSILSTEKRGVDTQKKPSRKFQSENSFGECPGDQWLGLRAFTAKGTGSMPWSEHAACPAPTPVPFKKRQEGKKIAFYLELTYFTR